MSTDALVLSLAFFLALCVSSTEEKVFLKSFNGGVGPLEVNCYNLKGQACEGPIPHSTQCKLFYICAELKPGYPYGVLFSCQTDLFFSMESCRCENGNDGCFDAQNSTHNADQFKCATLLPYFKGKRTLLDTT